MIRNFKLRAIIGGGLLAVAALVGAVAILAPASAESVAKQLISFACFDNQQCIKITNTSPTGKAIVGIAQNDSAVLGQINLNANKNPNPNVGAFFVHAGVRGDDLSTNPLDTNAGVLGVSKQGDGVAGVTTCGSCRFGPVGVFGLDSSSTTNFNAGVLGSSKHNIGVLGAANDPSTGTGVIGIDNGGFGVFGLSGSKTIAGVAVFGDALLGFGGLFESDDPALPAIAVDNQGGGPVIQAFGGQGGDTEVMLLDNAGDLTIAGNLQTGATPMAVNATASGRKVLTYAAQQSVRTIEDMGEAQLVRGQAIVRLEPTFAGAIDTRRSYLVFITPQGDTNGFLYVAQKNATGFVVREHDGASNVAFDYRIVAQPYGSVAPRMPLYVEQQDATAVAAESRMTARARSMRHSQIRP